MRLSAVCVCFLKFKFQVKVLCALAQHVKQFAVLGSVWSQLYFLLQSAARLLFPSSRLIVKINEM